MTALQQQLFRSYHTLHRACSNQVFGQRARVTHKLHHQPQRHFVQAIKKLFHPSNAELNDLEEQAYGCTENGQYTRALWGFEQLMQKEPNCARYYFDYALTIIRYIDDPPREMIDDAHRYLEKAVELAPTESRIIKSYGQLLMNTAFDDKAKCIADARALFDGYCQRVLGSGGGGDAFSSDHHYLQSALHGNNDDDIDSSDTSMHVTEWTDDERRAHYAHIDTEILFLYAQLLDEECRDYVAAKRMFEHCIYIASAQQCHYEQVDNYRLRYGFHLYKQQEFDAAIEQFKLIHENYRLHIEAYNADPNEGKEKRDRVHLNNYLRRRKPHTISHIFAHLYLGLIYGDLCEFQRSDHHFEAMMSFKDKFYVKNEHRVQIVLLCEYILHCVKMGHFERAHECWLEAFRLDKLLSVNTYPSVHYLGTTSYDVLTIGGHLFSEKGLTKKANRYFQNLMQMIASMPQEKLEKSSLFNPYYFYGVHCIKMEEFETAKQSFLKLCKMHPYFPEFYYQLSVACAQLKQYEEAQTYLMQAMNLNFRMIYPKYFANSDTIFKKVQLVLPEEKKQLLAK